MGVHITRVKLSTPGMADLNQTRVEKTGQGEVSSHCSLFLSKMDTAFAIKSSKHMYTSRQCKRRYNVVILQEFDELPRSKISPQRSALRCPWRGRGFRIAPTHERGGAKRLAKDGRLGEKAPGKLVEERFLRPGRDENKAPTNRFPHIGGRMISRCPHPKPAPERGE
ncbi:hypothetical protein Pan181_26820 [Aeoliella mucimassa]|uniref:Uncharacterized protein n=1 Tax=Aeoliella mucimassa TaxID=2527972 RepID=A0A518AP25_9BACT|nr:hypothetical protein Pan181_26820 [Aeoliella mucimassa]